MAKRCTPTSGTPGSDLFFFFFFFFFGMRYPKDQKQATRQRILEAAGRRFKADGIDGAGVAAVMSDAAYQRRLLRPLRLQGGSRRQRPRRPATSSTRELPAAPSDRAGLESLIRAYLSPEHRDQSADGCPSAALLDDIVAAPPPRTVFTNEVLATADDIAARLDPTDANAARTDALTLLGFVIGTMQLSRALTTPPYPITPQARCGKDLEAARPPRIVHADVTTAHGAHPPPHECGVV